MLRQRVFGAVAVGVSDGIAIAAMFLVALVVGTVNGISVAYLGMPAFLATLATQCMCRGLSLVLTGGASYRNLGASFTFFGKPNCFQYRFKFGQLRFCL